MSYPQSFQYKRVDQNLKAKTAVTHEEICDITKQLFANAKSLTLYLPPNYDKTGNTDYTDYLQKGINESTDIIFPDFPVLIAPKGLFLKSNSNILFLQNSKLKVKPNDKEFYAALNFENVENIKLYYANLEGERYHHLNNKGEWGMGIYIVHSKNIMIEKPNITKFWGDGLYVGKLDGITSSNIKINGAFLDENRRNGISIIAGEKILITNSIISNTNGASPEYGIDIEPNKSADDLNSIILSNNITFNNAKGGLLFALDNLQGKESKEIDIQVLNHTDYYSKNGIEFFIDRGYQNFISPIRGKITIDGANLFNNKTPLLSNDSKTAAIKLNLYNIKNNNIKLNASKIDTFVKKFNEGKLQEVR